jgi:hypothetical protein
MKPLTRALFVLAFAATALHAKDNIIVGTESGLYKVDRGSSALLWDKAPVRKILRRDGTWYFLTGAGIYASADLMAFVELDAGLPVKTIKIPEGGKKTFAREVQELKDLEIHPTNPLIMVTATKDSVYLTRDGGKAWRDIGLSAMTAGVKCVSVLDLPNSGGASQLTVFMSHPIYGVSYKQPDVSKNWVDLDDGLEQVPTIKWPDEIADLSASARNGTVELFASQTFMPRLYRLDWQKKAFARVWAGTGFIDSVEALALTDRSVLSTGTGKIREIPVAPALAPLTAPSQADFAITDWNADILSAPG